jgi:hypothetical protein
MVCRPTSSDRMGMEDTSCPLIRFIDYNGQLTKIYPSHRYPIDRKDVEHFGTDGGSLWKHGDMNYYLEYGSDTIFQIRKDSILPIRKLTGELKAGLMDYFLKDIGRKLKSGVALMSRPNAAIFESDRYIIFNIFGNDEFYFKTFDKQTRRFQRTFYKDIKEYEFEMRKMNFFIDDIISGLHFTPQYQNDGKTYALISAAEVCENKSSILTFINNHPSAEGAKLKPIVENMTEDDNALLMIVSFN